MHRTLSEGNFNSKVKGQWWAVRGGGISSGSFCFSPADFPVRAVGCSGERTVDNETFLTIMYRQKGRGGRGGTARKIYLVDIFTGQREQGYVVSSVGNNSTYQKNVFEARRAGEGRGSDSILQEPN